MIRYRIIRIDEDDFGCEGRPQGYVPAISVYIEDEQGEQMVLRMEDALLYERNLDVGAYAVIGEDHTLYPLNH